MMIDQNKEQASHPEVLTNRRLTGKSQFSLFQLATARLEAKSTCPRNFSPASKFVFAAINDQASEIILASSFAAANCRDESLRIHQ